MKTQKLWALVVVCLLTFSALIRAQQTEVSFSTAPQRPRPWDEVKEVVIGSAVAFLLIQTRSQITFN